MRRLNLQSFNARLSENTSKTKKRDEEEEMKRKEDAIADEMPLEGSPDFNSLDKSNMLLELPKGFMTTLAVPDLPPVPLTSNRIAEEAVPLDIIVE